MAVRLDTPERDLALLNRQPGGAPAAAEDAEAELAEFRERLDAARQLPPPADVPCRACWDKGRNAAIASVMAGGVPEGDAGAQLQAYADRIDRARVVEPGSMHWREQWIAGRDAALEALEGA